MEFNVLVWLEDPFSYECQQCNTEQTCCTNIIRLYYDDVKNIWDNRQKIGITNLDEVIFNHQKSAYLLKKKDPSNKWSECVFYQENKGCKIHAKAGKENKPLICQAFPHEIEIIQQSQTPDLIVKFSRAETEYFSCPAKKKQINMKETEDLITKIISSYTNHVNYLQNNAHPTPSQLQRKFEKHEFQNPLIETAIRYVRI